MLCTQNVANIYRKAALQVLRSKQEGVIDGAIAEQDVTKEPASSDLEQAPDEITEDGSLCVFEEAIDFSLEASVPDPIPFSDKLVNMLDKHDQFIRTPLEHETANSVLAEVGRFQLWTLSSTAALDTEQVCILLNGFMWNLD